MNQFFDTEFMENGPDHPIHLISIGMVNADGDAYYAINEEAPVELANAWVQKNVLPMLDLRFSKPRKRIRSDLLEFAGNDPIFWGYYADYDWVVLCQLFGAMVNLPKGWPMYCRDLKQWCDALGNPKLPKQTSKEHHALADAHWNMQVHEFLSKLEAGR